MMEMPAGLLASGVGELASKPSADPASAAACEAAARSAERLGDHAAAEAHLTSALAHSGCDASLQLVRT